MFAILWFWDHTPVLRRVLCNVHITHLQQRVVRIDALSGCCFIRQNISLHWPSNLCLVLKKLLSKMDNLQADSRSESSLVTYPVAFIWVASWHLQRWAPAACQELICTVWTCQFTILAEDFFISWIIMCRTWFFDSLSAINLVTIYLCRVQYYSAGKENFFCPHNEGQWYLWLLSWQVVHLHNSYSP